MIKAFNNKIEGAARLVYANQDPVQFDAYLASSRNEVVPNSYKTLSGGNTYNNFDTSSTMYKYTPDSPDDVANIVTTYSGRVDGGDLIWKFTNADDTSYTIDQGLLNKINNYSTNLVSANGNN